MKHWREYREMATFVDVHGGSVGMTGAQPRAAHEADPAIDAEEGVHFGRAWLDPGSGKVFRLSTGPGKEAVMRVRERAGNRTTEVYEVSVEIG